MTERDKAAPNGLVVARNAVAAVGAVMLLFGLFAQQSLGDAWQVPLWIGMLCLVTAAGLALTTTRWKALPTGTKIVIVIALVALSLVLVDVVSS